MLAVERRNKIELFIKQRGTVYVDELSDHFNVTKETIRKDLDKLEIHGILTKIYGGAILNQNNVLENMSYADRLNSNIAEKKKIADKASPLFSNHMTVFCDCSTTALGILRRVQEMPLTVITNSVAAVNTLGGNFTIISTGGNFNPSAMSFSGAIAEKMLSQHYTDIAVIGCKAIDQDHGITESNQPVIPLKQMMMKHAAKTVIGVCSNKFNKTALSTLCDFSDIDYLVTDKQLPDHWDLFMAEYNIKVL